MRITDFNLGYHGSSRTCFYVLQFQRSVILLNLYYEEKTVKLASNYGVQGLTSWLSVVVTVTSSPFVLMISALM